jgi:ABC-type methionine transport system ATPase subunit
VLDDATSAIDAEVEAEILAGLRDARAGATVVMVAARTSTISLADEVVHLVAGRVATAGRTGARRPLPRVRGARRGVRARRGPAGGRPRGGSARRA